MNITRRAALGGMFALPATAGAARAHESELDRFLREASAADRATHHANQLADALAEAHGGVWGIFRVACEEHGTNMIYLKKELAA